MKDKSLTALMCMFVKAYHYKDKDINVYDDYYSSELLLDSEFKDIKNNLIKGIKYFNNSFIGNDDDALKYIIYNNLGGSIIARSKFNEDSILNAIRIGCKQLLIIGCGYDTFSIKYKDLILKNNIRVFEVDRKDMIDDKINRFKKNSIDYSYINYVGTDFNEDNMFNKLIDCGFDTNKITFCSLLGIVYYLSINEFNDLLKILHNNLLDGSSILFDYPNNDKCNISKQAEELASSAKEEMKSKYSYKDMESILSNNNFLIYEHLNNIEMFNNYFKDCNINIKLPVGVSYLLAIKKDNI